MMTCESENNSLIDKLVARKYIKSDKVETAFRKTLRHHFIPPQLSESAYADTPLPIGFGQTISAPHMVAIMTEALEVERSSKILEVGCGSGYQAAVLSKMVDDVVYSIERLSELAASAERNLENAGVSNIVVCVSDGTLGLAEKAPYDRIIVTAAAPKIPDALVDQLAEAGRLIIPVGGRMVQELVAIEKQNNEIIKTKLGGCVFVPLLGEDGW